MVPTEISNLHVRLTAIDEVTPVIKGIRREMFWWRYGPTVATAVLTGIGIVVGFLLGMST